MRIALLVRHADINLPRVSGDEDPPLNAAGQARATTLASAVKAAGVTALLTSSFRRARETAAPFASLAGLVPEEATTPEEVLSRLTAIPADSRALVIGHSNTLPDIVHGLGVLSGAPTIGEGDFDNLFVVVVAEPESARLLVLKYGS